MSLRSPLQLGRVRAYRQSCIVTGGGTGLGKAFATALAINGAKVSPDIPSLTPRG
jgi:hypothetical protein